MDKRRLFRGLTVISALSFLSFILYVIYLANTGGQSVFFKLIKTIPYGDKLGHFMLFGMLTLLANFAFNHRFILLGNVKLWWGTLLVSGFVIFEETSQAFNVNRTFDLMDMTANAVGIIVFSLISLLWLKQKERRVQVTNGQPITRE